MAGGQPPAAARRQGLEPEVTFAHNLHLSGCGFYAGAAPSHHGRQQFPTAVGHQFQKAFIDHGHGDFAARRRRLAGGSHRFDLNFYFLADLINLRVRGDG